MHAALTLGAIAAVVVVVAAGAWTVLDAQPPPAGATGAQRGGGHLPDVLDAQPVLAGVTAAPPPSPSPEDAGDGAGGNGGDGDGGDGGGDDGGDGSDGGGAGAGDEEAAAQRGNSPEGPGGQPAPDGNGSAPEDPDAAGQGTAQSTTESGPPASQAVDIQAAKARFCVTPGWPCRAYTWSFAGGHYWLVLELDPNLYQTYRSEDKPDRLRAEGTGYVSQAAYDIHVSDPRDDRYVDHIARELRRMAATAGMQGREPEFILAFVQGLRYTSDSVTTGFDEYPRYPLETLVDEGGDCEDTAILYASLVMALGHEAVLLSPPRHMAVGVLAPGGTIPVGGKAYSFAETTGQWPLGKVPPDFADKEMQVWSLQPAPLFALSRATASVQDGAMDVRSLVVNMGSVVADVRVASYLVDAQGTVHASADCLVRDLGLRAEAACDVSLDLAGVHKGQEVRLEVRAHGGAILHDVLATSYFAPWP